MLLMQGAWSLVTRLPGNLPYLWQERTLVERLFHLALHLEYTSVHEFSDLEEVLI